MQGELLRAVEKLRDEAQRNGNKNWDHGHEILANYVRSTLIDFGHFESSKQKEIIKDINRLLSYDQPYTEDDIYDRLCDRIVDFSIQNPKPIKHDYNNKLHR